MKKARKQQFSDKEVLAARIFCVVVGLLTIVGGRAIAVQPDEFAQLAGTVVAVLGAGIALFGLFASRNGCVVAAGWVLALVSH